MNRRMRMLTVFGVAIVLASLASYGAYRAVQQMPVREVTVVERQMVVATQPLEAGVVLTNAHVRLQPWPATAAVDGGFESIADVVGRGLMAPVVPNEVIIAGKLAPRDGGAGLPPSIPQGMRGMAVRVNDVIGVAGFAMPGTRVDVVVTVRSERESVSRVVLSNVRVLAVGTRADAGAAGGAAASNAMSVVTLLVTPEDAERLALAQSQGSIVLALRNPLDTAPVDTRGVRTAGLFAEAAPPAATAPARTSAPRPRPQAPPPPPPPADYAIETIKGAERSKVVIKDPAAGGGGGKGGA
jgi:pilus assembly protein CpaB